jgi:predicted RNase H-like HicB family nuclease
MAHQLTGILYEDGEPPLGYLVYCPQLDVLTQGDSIEHAQAMIRDAVEGVLEILPAEEVERRLRGPLSSLEETFEEDDEITIEEVGRFTFAVNAPVSGSAIG